MRNANFNSFFVLIIENTEVNDRKFHFSQNPSIFRILSTKATKETEIPHATTVYRLGNLA